MPTHEEPWWQGAMDWLMPPRCVACGRRGVEICRECWAAVQPLGPALCPHCSVPTREGRVCRQCSLHPRAVRAILARYPFEGAVRAALVALKYRSRRRLVPILTSALEEALARRPIAFDLVVPVPLSAGRLRARGFNQSELLARPLAAQRQAALASSALVRHKETRPQTDLPARDRRRNVVEAFSVPEPELVAARRILLVDDVCTTGATLDACAAALLTAGAAGVWAIVVAREVPGRGTP